MYFLLKMGIFHCYVSLLEGLHARITQMDCTAAFLPRLGKALAETNDWQSCLDMLKDFQSSGEAPKQLVCLKETNTTTR